MATGSRRHPGIVGNHPFLVTAEIHLHHRWLDDLSEFFLYCLSESSNDGTGRVRKTDCCDILSLLWFPYGIAVDSVGDVYVADTGNNTIRRGFAASGAPAIASSWPTFGFNNGQFGFNLAGPPGQVEVIDASTNLQSWLPIWTNTIGAGASYFWDPQSGTHPNRSYRAHIP